MSNLPTPESWVSLRDHLDRVITEHDRINMLRVESLRQSFAAYAQAAERAVEVSRTAQQKVQETSNEFRAALGDANTRNVSRTEADARLASLSERIDELAEEIAGLRESRSAGEGKGIGANALWGYILGGIGLLALILSILERISR